MADPIRRALGMGAALAMALAPAKPRAAVKQGATAHDFTLPGIEGGPIAMKDFAGKPVLVVNTASFCGFTYQYEGLQRLYDRYHERGLVVLGVPSNDFRQEKGSAAEVKSFCETTFGVEFPMTDILSVSGRNAHPLFAWFAQQKGPPRWNFTKYLVAPDGTLAGMWGSTTDPDSRTITTAVERLLPGA